MFWRSPSKFYTKLRKVYKKYDPCFSTVKNWAIEFRGGCTFFEDDTYERTTKTGQPPKTTSERFFKYIRFQDEKATVYAAFVKS